MAVRVGTTAHDQGGIRVSSTSHDSWSLLEFTGAPYVASRTVDSYTVSGTVSEDCTVYGVATLTTADDPDGAQVAAGTDGAGDAARGTGSVSATGAVEFTFSITGPSLADNVTHDLHIVARKVQA